MRKIVEDNIWLISVVIAVINCYSICLVSVYYLNKYGFTVFVLSPFLLGLIPPIVYGSIKKISEKESTKIGLAALGIFCISTLIFAIEGIICIIMASPIMVIFTLIGALIGYQLIKNKHNPKNQIYSIVLLPFIFLSIDLIVESEEFLEVKTTIEINAPIEEVWENIVSFGKIDDPEEWIFKTGIAYPTDARIEGNGEGAVRYCNFTTGSFVEPITAWEEPSLLKFNVQDQPTPMRELNPFWDVHPPHLNGYFQSKKGQFKLIRLENGNIQVEGTTWYNIHIHPIKYWDIWSKFILHKIHYRVLKHIKKESEEK